MPVKHHHPQDTSFIQRTGAGVKRHAASTVIASIIGVLTGTFIPMLEQWHNDAQAAAQISELKSDLRNEISEVKSDQEQSRKSMWDAISKKQDKYEK